MAAKPTKRARSWSKSIEIRVGHGPAERPAVRARSLDPAPFPQTVTRPRSVPTDGHSTPLRLSL